MEKKRSIRIWILAFLQFIIAFPFLPYYIPTSRWYAMCRLASTSSENKLIKFVDLYGPILGTFALMFIVCSIGIIFKKKWSLLFGKFINIFIVLCLIFDYFMHRSMGLIPLMAPIISLFLLFDPKVKEQFK